MRVVLVGDSGVGKSKLLHRYIHDEFDHCLDQNLYNNGSTKFQVFADI